MIIGGILIVPFWVALKPSYLKHASERLGILPYPENCIWIHAASVGEIKASVPFLKKIISSGYNVLLTTITPAGRNYASTLNIKGLSISYAPFDSIILTCYAVRRVKPAVLVILETEIWPNLIVSASKAHVKIVSINARLSQKAAKNYMYIRSTMAFLLNRFQLICVQTPDDAGRFSGFGVDRHKIHITDNIKYAVMAEKKTMPTYNIKSLFPNRRIIIAGSTHSGEEQIVVNCFKSLKQYFDALLLILAPRHINRINEVEGIIEEAGLTCVKFSSLSKSIVTGKFDILLLDTIGELSNIYSIGDAVFIGGSMVPVGGHNLIEAVIYKKPVIYGQYINSIKEFVSLLEGNGGIMIRDENELCSTIKDLLEHPDKTEVLGNRAYNAIKQKTDVLDNIMEIMREKHILKTDKQ